MGDWNIVQASTGRSARVARPNTSGVGDVETFLARYKTTECTKFEEHHDRAICHGFHNKVGDRRRNPYNVYYSLDDCLNVQEEMYHPAQFRTSLCRGGLTCRFGDACSHAHGLESLRNRTKEESAYDYDHFVETRQRPQFISFVPSTETPKINYHAACHSLWREHHIPAKSAFIPLDDAGWFFVNRSEALFSEMREFAFAQGLGLIDRTTASDGKQMGLGIQGIHVGEISSQVKAMLKPPSNHFAVEERKYGSRVADSLRNLLETPTGRFTITKSENVIIQIIADSVLRVSAVHSKQKSADEFIKEVLDKVKFWISQQKLDKFTECSCCYDKLNRDQGVSCVNNHFYCADCFGVAVQSQILQIATREEVIVCPNCSDAYATQDIASHLSREIWDQVEKAMIDKKVQKETEVLARQFDERLHSRVKELMQKYGDADEMLRVKARDHALQIRNTIMNLSCPHCEIAYFDFSGCMALKCQTCEGNFCGYCHQKTATGQGAHEHVRTCLMNDTSNGSYYATAEEIEKSQRRYRTREIKKYLQRLKKDVQNATVIELAGDLKDIGIEQEALFEFGNLLGDDLF
jgi:hypothetical protein